MELIKEMKEHAIPVISTKPYVYCKVFEDNSGALELARLPKLRPRTRHSLRTTSRAIVFNSAENDYASYLSEGVLHYLLFKYFGTYFISIPLGIGPTGLCHPNDTFTCPYGNMSSLLTLEHYILDLLHQSTWLTPHV